MGPHGEPMGPMGHQILNFLSHRALGPHGPAPGRSSPCIGQNNTSKRFSFFEEIFGGLRGCRVQESSKSVDLLEGPGGGPGGRLGPRGGGNIMEKIMGDSQGGGPKHYGEH